MILATAINSEFKEKIEKYTRRHYTLQYEDTRLEYFKSIFYGFLFLLIGIIVLATYITLSTTVLKDNSIFIEIICILSWVFVWESVNRFFFEGHRNRVEVKNAAQIALAEITFNKVPKSKK